MLLALLLACAPTDATAARESAPAAESDAATTTDSNTSGCAPVAATDATCDFVDDDCDGAVDEDAPVDDDIDPNAIDASEPGPWYLDCDLDGSGAGDLFAACDEAHLPDPGACQWIQFADDDYTDCDDADAFVHVGQLEVCDGIDNNCDGWIDNLDGGACE